MLGLWTSLVGGVIQESPSPTWNLCLGWYSNVPQSRANGRKMAGSLPAQKMGLMLWQGNFRRWTKIFQSHTMTEMSLSFRMWEVMPLFHSNRPHIFKNSFNNIRLEIHLVLSQWDHRDTITNISSHYGICRFKWHIYILSVWEPDKQRQQIGLECWRMEDLAVDFNGGNGHQSPASLIGPIFLLLSFSCFSWQQRMLTVTLNSLNSDFLSDQKMTNEVFTPVDEHITKMT